MAQTKKPGPEPLHPSMRRTSALRIYVTPGEAKRLRAAARPKRLSDWARRVLVDAASE